MIDELINLTQFTKILSPAKLNLGLKIVGKTKNNYHLLNTIFGLINLTDVIYLKINNTLKQRINFINYHNYWPIDHDLIYQAIILLQTYTNSKYDLDIIIEKHIPIGAGLGGGSSNAAAILLLLNQMLKLQLSTAELITLGCQLGADVPLFIYRYHAFANNIGDQLFPIILPIRYFILINPNINISTKKVFQNFQYNQITSIFEPITPYVNQTINLVVINNEVDQRCKQLFVAQDNDLLGTVIKLYPQLKAIIAHINTITNNQQLSLTGSGSTLYLTFNDLHQAKIIADKLKSWYNIYLVNYFAST